MRESHFAVGLGGWTVCLPATATLEYVARTSLYPVPLAPGAMVGLTQLRGQPVAVFDAKRWSALTASAAKPAGAVPMRPPAAPAAAIRAIISHGDVLVVGTLPQATALLIDAPPWPVPAARLPGQPLPPEGAPSACPFRAAIVSRCILHPGGTQGEAGRQTGDPHDMSGATGDWYEVDPDRLFRILSSS